MYHAYPGRHRRAVQFYGQFIRPGDLCFDVGAHVGGRVRAWIALGARVVAVEPQPQCLAWLEHMYGRSDQVEIVPAALGTEAGNATLHISRRTPTVTTMSDRWIESLSSVRSFRRVSWDRQVEVDMLTLDHLIARFGEPAFCKIDVEGFEYEVLQGLSRPLRALSFEYLPARPDLAIACLTYLASLGNYRFNRSLGEQMQWFEPEWLGERAMIEQLQQISPDSISGDVYARLE